ncbi:MAG TPA: hypothetical protein VFB12_03000 [Ktedonobacteraceae bacterium]|nr:hypothetical protein [Ktedonobacteraceae bacterium]
MASNEEHSEHTQRKWLSRLAEERHNLSVSVEEALGDQTLDEEQALDEASLQDRSMQVAHGETLFPPRISLQSRPMPTVIPGGFVEAASRSQSGIPSSENVQEADSTAQNTNILKRFAQRLTTSLSAFGSTKHLEAVASSPTPSQQKNWPREEKTPGQEKVEYPQPLVKLIDKTPSAKSAAISPAPMQNKQRLAGRASRIRLETASIQAVPKPMEQQTAEPPSEMVHEAQVASAVSRDMTEEIPFEDWKMTSTYQPAQEPPREGASTTSAHLPAVEGSHEDAGSLPAHLTMLEPIQENVGRVPTYFPDADLPYDRASSEIAQTIDIPREEAKPVSAHIPALDALREEDRMSSSYIPAMNPSHEKAGPDSLPVPTMGEAAGALATARGALSGSGIIESGQGDVIVSNPHVTSSSVVLVTLTANPGPVVVQYVSLQPQKGFTIHLTAPAAAKTPFNYIILLGELF